jgi:hypothetical protein
LKRPLRILYAAGPGNVIRTFEHWKAGRDDPSQVAVTYSGQFYDVARIWTRARPSSRRTSSGASCRDGNFRIEHRPFPAWARGGALYHVSRVVVRDAPCHDVDRRRRGRRRRLDVRPLVAAVAAAVDGREGRAVAALRAAQPGAQRPASWLERRNIKFLAESEVGHGRVARHR